MPPWLDADARHALALSTLAGLSTTIGAAAAVRGAEWGRGGGGGRDGNGAPTDDARPPFRSPQVVRRPGPADLAFLLGLAVGVMGVLAVGEMYLHAASVHGFWPVTLAFAGGALTYLALQPLLPEPDVGRWGVGSATAGAAVVPGGRRPGLRSAARGANGAAPAVLPAAPADLLRLGLVMALTMTLHNFPEGFAVAFSSFTPLGPLMAAAIAVHNIPEGVVVAAPVFAATGSRPAALALAALSGLSEPVGALVALTVARPLATEARLAYVLAAAGGVMAAVCAADLVPHGVRCAAPRRLVAGVAVGAAAMGWTLWLGV